MGLRAILLAVVMALAPVVASACQPNWIVEWLDGHSRVAYASNGSFTGGGEDDDVKGGPIKDLGGQKIYQVLSSKGSCSLTQSVLVTDCGAEATAVLSYWPKSATTSTTIEVFHGTNPADALLPPNGILANVSQMSLPELVAHAVAQGATEDTYQLDQNAKEKLRDRFLPFYGCNIFYRGTPGALRWSEGF